MAYDDPRGYPNQSYVSLATGSYDNADKKLIPQYVVGGITYPAYSSGSTSVLYILPTGGSVTINGLSADQCSSGRTLIIANLSTNTAYQLIFPHLAGTSSAANQFSNANLANAYIFAGAAARCTWLYPPGAANGFWQFA